MRLAVPGTTLDTPLSTVVVGLAHRSPGRLLGPARGPALSAPLMVEGRWRARRDGTAAATASLAVPVVVALSGHRSLPGPHAAAAFLAAVALFFGCRRLGAVASAYALAAVAPGARAGVRRPYGVVAGAALGGPAGSLATKAPRWWPTGPAGRPALTWSRPLPAAGTG
ncbi:hypothetical protein [Streptomyces sp. NPDC048191]|uniref:hypothetical protein n=1 Tax=Streptomyces sp. NPDC048191 TaxID=3155484 RepID=UPI00340E3733